MARPKKEVVRETAGVSTELLSLVNSLQKKYPGKVLLGDQYTMPWAVRRIPFGIPDLDTAIQGGAPGGGITMLVGPPSEGKNFLLNKLYANVQHKFGDAAAIAHIGTELPYDKTQGRKIGVRVGLSPSEIEMANAERLETGRQALTDEERHELAQTTGTFVTVPPSTVEESFEIAVDLVRSRLFHIIGLDSFGSMLTDDDKDKSFEDSSRVGGPAGLNTKLVRKLCEAFSPDDDGNPNLTVFVGINQVRDKIGAQAFEKKTQESGGWSLKHGRFITIELSHLGALRDDNKKKIGKTIKWEITKQKAGGHEGAFGTYNYIYDDCNIDYGELLLRVGVECEVIEKSGITYSYAGETLGAGAGKAAAKINSNPELLAELLEAVTTVRALMLK